VNEMAKKAKKGNGKAKAAYAYTEKHGGPI